jgi:hypothetical protein
MTREIINKGKDVRLKAKAVKFGNGRLHVELPRKYFREGSYVEVRKAPRKW